MAPIDHTTLYSSGSSTTEIRFQLTTRNWQPQGERGLESSPPTLPSNSLCKQNLENTRFFCVSGLNFLQHTSLRVCHEHSQTTRPPPHGNVAKAHQLPAGPPCPRHAVAVQVPGRVAAHHQQRLRIGAVVVVDRRQRGQGCGRGLGLATTKHQQSSQKIPF